MIYDQAVTIVLDQGGPIERITVNLKYTIKKEISPSDWPKAATSDYHKFDSVCHETMVGFWQDGGTNISCVVGKQVNASDDIVLDEQKTWYKQAYFKV
jgi:hypothetical protein